MHVMNLSVNILEILEILKNISYKTLRDSHYNVRQLRSHHITHQIHQQIFNIVFLFIN